MKTRISSIALALMLLAGLGGQVAAQACSPADMPYETYTYSLENKPLIVPAAYSCTRIVEASELGLDGFKDLSDLFYDGQYLYLCDSGNNRVVVMDTDMALQEVIGTFDYQGESQSFQSPTGVYVNDEAIYIADSLNSRIVVFDRETREALRILDRPAINLLAEDYTYTPLKITVDAADRIYVIAGGINRGLIELDEDGAFSTFLGAPAVAPDFLGLLWRQFATREQIARLDKFVPTEYDAVSIDENGFLYAVSKSSENDPFVKLNLQGTDVLQFEDSFGDEDYRDAAGTVSKPYFVDMAVSGQGNYYLLDSLQGKIYVYTAQGQLLYAFGSNSAQKGSFYSASAIQLADDRLFVIDSSKGTISIFQATAFGKTVEDAVYANDQGEYDKTRVLWQDVLARCSHYPMAIIGLSKIAIQDGGYRGAMQQLKAIHATKDYGEAFDRWRDDFLRRQMALVFLAVLLLASALVLVPRLLRRTALAGRVGRTKIFKEYKYGTYSMTHPFDGFWDIKRERRGSMPAALLLLGLFSLCYGIRAQFSGYLATGTDSTEINAIYECLMILLPLMLWVVANWCFTTLMDGDGSLKDIFIFTCYALKPYILFSIPMFFLSHMLTAEEMIFYQVLNSICFLWMFLLLFIGMMMTHDYTLAKAVLTLLCTLVGICLILFIGLLFLNIVQDVMKFFMDIYSEVSFRAY
ncbi:MAG: YIP1 family protein [Saccharofermentanales bacterium]